MWATLSLRPVLPLGVFLSCACYKFFKILYRRIYGVRTWSTLYMQLFWHLLMRFGVRRYSPALIKWVYNNVPIWQPSFKCVCWLTDTVWHPITSSLGVNALTVGTHVFPVVTTWIFFCWWHWGRLRLVPATWIPVYNVWKLSITTT